MTVHQLKCQTPYFAEVAAGTKMFEVRYNDRGYQRGDTIVLTEYEGSWQTGNPPITLEVTYVYAGDPRFRGGLAAGWVVLGLAWPPEDQGQASADDFTTAAVTLVDEREADERFFNPSAPLDPSDLTLARLTTDPEDPRLTHGNDSEPAPQATAYLVLSADERAKGFIRPVRRSYVHTGGCGGLTTMSRAIAETYARNPHFYGSTYCVGCGMHRPVGADGEFIWDDGSGQKVGI
jgi:hypothetical protein